MAAITKKPHTYPWSKTRRTEDPARTSFIAVLLFLAVMALLALLMWLASFNGTQGYESYIS